MCPKVTKHLPREVNSSLVWIFQGKLYLLLRALLRLSFSSLLCCEGYMLCSFLLERQFDKFHFCSWQKSPVNAPRTEQGQTIFRRSDGPQHESPCPSPGHQDGPDSSLNPDPCPAWRLMGAGGAPGVASLTPESGILGHSSVLREPQQVQARPSCNDQEVQAKCRLGQELV